VRISDTSLLYDYKSLTRVIMNCFNMYILNYNYGARTYIFYFVLLSSNKLFPTETGNNDILFVARQHEQNSIFPIECDYRTRSTAQHSRR
jgi:hypothetical protein